MRRTISCSAVLGLALRAMAQISTQSPPDTGISFKLNIPASTASSGNGDIFFQVSAPTSYEWVALGQGSGMIGSNIFVMYTSKSGTNVTISPRIATAYREPRYNSNAQVTLLQGSGVIDGKMVANVKCSNCNSWSGGNADFKQSSESWVYAYHASGGPKNSDDKSAGITQHDNQRAFTWSYANAKGGNSANPFVSSSPTGTGATVSCVPRPTSTTKGSSSSARSTQTSTSTPQAVTYCDDLPSDSNSEFSPIVGSNPLASMNKRLAAHGILASLAFVVLFPAGAIAVRLGSFRFVVAFHAAFQVFAYLVYIAAFGLGITLAKDLEVRTSQHPIIGIVVFILLFLQPFLGFTHHAMFKKHQARTVVSHAHIWVGRIAIALGIVNGGLGFRLANRMGMGSKSGKIAYAIIAAIFGLAWIVSIVIGERKRAKQVTEKPPHYTESPESPEWANKHPKPATGGPK